MKKTSLFLTEPIGYPDKVDTNSLIAESCRRYDTYALRPEGIVLKAGASTKPKSVSLTVKAHKVTLDKKGNLSESAETKEIEINKNTIVTIRLNPPFDSRYFTAMKLLSYKEDEALILNRPSSIINFPEKLFHGDLLKFMPETVVTEDLEEIKKFWKSKKDIVVKPLYEFAGRSVFRLREEEENYKSIFQMLRDKYHEPLVAQVYLPAVKQGDKRIVLYNGEYEGCFNRVPPKGQIQAAYAAGGSLQKSKLTKREKEICEAAKPIMKANGIFICGLDVIGDCLTEVNITCPGGTAGLNMVYGGNSEKTYWDMVEMFTKKRG